MYKFTSLFFVLVFASTVNAVETPNLLFILADDLGWADTTLYGKTSLYETPNIERLAARGMTFNRAYSASPLCSPTRASILTGQNPARLGFTQPAGHLKQVRLKPTIPAKSPPYNKSTNVQSITRLNPKLPALSRLLKNAGYSTAHFGKWHLGTAPYSPLQFGFDIDIPHWPGPGPAGSYVAPWKYPNFKAKKPKEHIEDRMAEEAIHWLKNRDKNKPFFLNYWQFSVHGPFDAKQSLIDRYRKKIDLKSKQKSPTYAAMVHSLDDAVGRLLDTIDSEGLTKNTIIVFYSDNGGNNYNGLIETTTTGKKYVAPITSNHPLRGSKGNINEGGIRVPAIIVWPGVTKPGSRSEVRIQSTDLYPTLLNILKVKWPDNHAIDGVDIQKALRGESMDRGPMFTYFPSFNNTPKWLPPSMAVHQGDWKLIRVFHYGENGKHDYKLFNLKEDMGENHNVAKAHPDKVKELDQLIQQYIHQAKVLVPQPNPGFDPAKFKPELIGVQKGGLKMPRLNKSRASPSNEAQSRPPELKGWTLRGAKATVEPEAIKIVTKGNSTFIAKAGFQLEKPVIVNVRLKVKSAGQGRVQWRTQGQRTFPAQSQIQSFEVKEGDWQELKIQIDSKGKLIHLRFYPPGNGNEISIDWIEVGSKDNSPKGRKRWDFGREKKSSPKN